MAMQSINAAASPEVQMNENFDTLSWAAVYGKRPPATTGMTWGYYGGRWGGFAVADGTVTLSNGDNYLVVLKSTGVLSVSGTTTNWNDATNYRRVYKITATASAVTAVEDHRAGTGGIFGN